jgi:hypothetical protein
MVKNKDNSEESPDDKKATSPPACEVGGLPWGLLRLLGYAFSPSWLSSIKDILRFLDSNLRATYLP